MQLWIVFWRIAEWSSIIWIYRFFDTKSRRTVSRYWGFKFRRIVRRSKKFRVHKFIWMDKSSAPFPMWLNCELNYRGITFAKKATVNKVPLDFKHFTRFRQCSARVEHVCTEPTQKPKCTALGWFVPSVTSFRKISQVHKSQRLCTIRQWSEVSSEAPTS
jgi:hypothetical protein